MSAAVAVRERPMLMSGEMVRATLEDRKTKTRRVVTRATSEVGTGLPWDALDWSRVQVDPGFGAGQYLHVGGPDDTMHRVRCRYAVGDHVWVRETWAVNDYGFMISGEIEYNATVAYRADDAEISHVIPSRFHDEEQQRDAAGRNADRWRPSIHMPRWASRLTLEITDVRVERVQDITHEDAVAEGVMSLPDTVIQDVARCCAAAGRTECGAVDYFERLWNWINLPRGYGWDANPWVWALSFRRVES